MKKRTKYTHNPELGELKIVSDFLPSPEELAGAEETIKVTIGLTQRSIDFFKKKAKEQNAQYQKLIRRLLDEYAGRYT